MRIAVVTFALVAASCAEQADSAPGDDINDAVRAILPLPPTVSDPAWQGRQSRFLASDGSPCIGSVALAVSNSAVCYVGVDDALRCAGRIHSMDFGSAFVASGLVGVDQVILSAANFDDDGFAAVCARLNDGTAWCLGDANGQGQFGNGSLGPTGAFTQFGELNNIVSLATGNFQQLCAIDTLGVTRCAGSGYGSIPVEVEPLPHASLWIDTHGGLHFDDVTVFRVSNSYSSCRVTMAGMQCDGELAPESFGLPGEVVDGTKTGFEASEGTWYWSDVCWLSAAGEVTCSRADPAINARIVVPAFVGDTVLALAGHPSTSTLCAVYPDASLWCVGENDHGQLGTGDLSPLAAETMVQPPGSVRVSCAPEPEDE